MKFLKIMYAAFRQSFVYDLQYRANFIINTIVNICWTTLSYLTITIIGLNAPIIADNWEKYEYRLIWGIFGCGLIIVNALFKRNMQDIPNKIVKGDLDFKIIRPFNSKLLSSVGYSRFTAIPSFLFTLGVTIHSLSGISTNYSFLVNVILALLFIISSAVIYYSIFMIFVSISFWFIGAYNLPNLVHNIVSFANYPIKAFGRGFAFVFTIIVPIAFLSLYPAEAILESSISKLILTFAVGIVLYKLSDIIWNIGLKNYSSASS